MPTVRNETGLLVNVSLADFVAISNGIHPYSQYNPSLVTRKKLPVGSVMLGADPEFFIANSKKLVPSCGLIGGDKAKGIPIDKETLGEGYTWLEDNVAVELNVPPAAHGPGFVGTMKAAVQAALVQLKKQQLHAVFKPALTFKAPDLIHPKSMVFGCEPDFCAYDDTSGRKPRTVDVNQFGNTRFAGGHIHLSFNNKESIPIYAVVMMLDAFVGLASISYDVQDQRRKAYGLAGLFRTKQYSDTVTGVEYRSLSNFWLPWATTDKHSYLQAMADTIITLGYSLERTPVELSKLFIRLPIRDIQQVIDSEDKKQAIEIHTFIRSLKEVQDTGLDLSFRPGMKYSE
jgi:hypothetical protein